MAILTRRSGVTDRMTLWGFALSFLLLALAVTTGSGASAQAVTVPALAAAATPSVPGCTASYGGKGQGADSWAATEPLQRDYYDANGPAKTSNCFEVSVNKHTDLQNHERITVTWSGARPTAGRSDNPYGYNGMAQEYPVMLLECRGVDAKDGSVLSGATQASPNTCFTDNFSERTASAQPGNGIWEQDASAGDPSGQIQGIAPKRVPKDCNLATDQDWAVTPFFGADGTFFAGCSVGSMPPEAGSTATIPNEAAAFTNTDGTGTFPFEVRSDLVNQSLGCNATTPCTLEIIPIDGVNCDNPDASAVCNQTGGLPVGQVNPGMRPQDAVSPQFWWTASNWDRRVPVPLNFAPNQHTCSIESAGQPVAFFGSELLAQTAHQWGPAYCLNKKRFNWQENDMSDGGAFGLLQNGGSAAAEVSYRQSGDTGIAYAPTAVTGFAIAFNIDKPGNAGQQMTLNLNAELLAKLLTQSYPGSLAVRQEHPGFANNPLSINLDPQFIDLNPGLDTSQWKEAEATMLTMLGDSSAMYALTSYIAADPQAMAFLHGKADPDGMVVNPFYKNVALPVSNWPIKDTWQWKDTNNPCLAAQGSAAPPYMGLIASPVSSLELVAEALLYNWPNISTACTGTGLPSDPYQLGRVSTQGYGTRFMLGLVTEGDAQRYGLTTASLQSTPGHFVPADSAGMAAALAVAKPTGAMLPWTLDQAKLRKSPKAYPGTMVVYTAAKKYGYPSGPTAADVAQFIRISSTEGQHPGRGNGQLAAGYLPIVDSGVTKPFFDQAQAVAAVVAAQKAPGTPTSTPSGNPTATPTSGTGGPGTTTSGTGPGGPGTTTGAPGATVPGLGPGVVGPGGTTPVTAPGGGNPSAGPSAPSGGTSTSAEPTTTAQLATTAAPSSEWGSKLILGLFGVGILAALLTLGTRIALHVKGLR